MFYGIDTIWCVIGYHLDMEFPVSSVTLLMLSVDLLGYVGCIVLPTDRQDAETPRFQSPSVH